MEYAPLSFSAQEIEAARVFFAGPCDFMLGVAALSGLPAMGPPEVAFAGRSNVGKSSLLNAITGRKALARTSNTPGRTQELNYFNAQGRLFLVDMPGYGYAKVSKDKIAAWQDLIFGYLRGRASLRCVFILVDARHGLKESDEALLSLLDKAGVASRIILTKADAVKPQERMAIVARVEAGLKKHPAVFPLAHLTSSDTGEGIAELRALLVGFSVA